jgi:DNA modification methylase
LENSKQKWPADKVARRPIGKLIPYAANARLHSEAQVAQIAASMKEWGWTNPVLVDEAGMIIAGHGRVLAARQLGLKSVPVMVAEGWSEAQKRAYVIADNQLALAADWDEALLSSEVRGLADWGFDLQLLGFNNLDELLAEQTEGLTDPDAVPPVPAEPVSLLGDVWTLGRHRLVCGDCTDPATVEACLGEVRPHLMVTDPPYGVEYDPGWRAEAGYSSPDAALGAVLNDDRADWREAWALFPGAVAYIWHSGLHAGLVSESLAAHKFRVRAQIIWVKTRPTLGRGHYHWQHENALYAVQDGADDGWRFIPEHEVADYAVREGEAGQWKGGRKQSTVWFIEHLKSGTGHGTQKPVECMKRPILNNSSAGQSVYEPFNGSGTTIIAGEMTGRPVYAIELSPAYVDVAIVRWQDFVGAEATLADGRSFAEVKAERAALAA